MKWRRIADTRNDEGRWGTTPPGFSALPDGVQEQTIRAALTHARQTAAELVKMQNPEIIQQAMQNKQCILMNGRASVR